MTLTERRPGPDGRNTRTFPRDFADLGPPPSDIYEFREWLLRNIERGEQRAARGERVPWLGRVERR